VHNAIVDDESRNTWGPPGGLISTTLAFVAHGASLDSMTLFTDGATPPMIANAGRHSAVAADHAHFCLGVELSQLTLSKIT